MKRILVFILMLALVFPFTAKADGPAVYESGDTVEYVGGVVERGRTSRLLMLLALRDQLDVAYVQLDQSYLTAGTPATWTVTASGGSGLYLYSFNLFYRAGNTGTLYLKTKQEKSDKNTFTCTPTYSSGQYMLQVTVYESTGAYLVWQSQIFEATKAGQEKDPQTVPGKVAKIAEECVQKAGSSDYARALWLHDYLTHNAEYDLTGTYYYADGVLLHGTGVCQSYALAYEMLLKAVGIETVYVTGEVGAPGETETHAWNLVKLNGKWYHVDCTWDDPIGGTETRLYFGLSDELIAKDHAWEGHGGVAPACESTDGSCLLNASGEVAGSRAEAEAILETAVKEKRGYVEILMTDKSANLSGIADDFLNKAEFSNRISDFSWTCEALSTYQSVVCLIDYGSGFPDLSSAQSVCLEPGPARVSAGGTVRLTALVSPADSGNLAWSSSDSSVIRVSNGVVTAIKPGAAIVTATCRNGKSSSVTVYVTGGTRLTVTGCVSVIESEAFSDSPLLESVTVKDGVTRIESRAFAGCPLLLEAHLPKSVVSVAPDAFPDNPGLIIYCQRGSAAEAFAKANGYGVEYE